jgi:hypothetical protein
MTCSDLAWHTVWSGFHHTRSDVVPVERKALADIVACAGKVPQDMALPSQRKGKLVKCDRAKLFDFLVRHGDDHVFIDAGVPLP